MSPLRRLVLLGAFGALLVLGIGSRVDAQPIIWFAPLSSTTLDHSGAPDYMELFPPGAPWGDVAAATSVFKLYPYFTGRASDGDLRTLFQSLKLRGIALALEARVLSTTPGCKMQSGDGGTSTIRLLQRIRRLGGNLKYLAMDEPLKHALTGDPSCRASLTQVADDIATNIRQYRQLFPSLQIGDIEPIGTWPNAPALLPDTLAWLDAYRRRMGENVAFFHADVGWTLPWLAIVTDLGQQLRDRHIPFGVIYNGDDLASSDEEWATEAEHHYRAFELAAASPPDIAVFQSWRPHPSRVLPETDPTTLTGIVRGYLDFRLSVR